MAERLRPIDPDAITLAGSWRHSYKSTEVLNVNEPNGSKRCHGTAVALNPSEHEAPPTGTNSPGYTRAEILRTHILPSEKIFIFASIVVLAIAHCLDNFLRVLYQFEVTHDFGKGSLIGAINTVSTLCTAALTPLVSKSTDVFGRPQTLLASIASYLLGTTLQAQSQSIILFSVGTVFWTVGLLGVISMFEIIIADITSIRLRVVAFYLPAVPYLAVTWVTAPLKEMLTGIHFFMGWQHRFALAAILYTVCSTPLILGLFAIENRVKKRSSSSSSKESEYRIRSFRGWISLRRLRFQQMDVFGWASLTTIVTCFLAPWSAYPVVGTEREKIFLGPAMIVIYCLGLLCVPVFYYVEKYSKYSIFPAQALREKRVLVALMMGFLYHLAYYVQHTYLFIGLRVRYDQSEGAAARVVGLYTFTSTLFGIFLGAVISVTRDFTWYLRLGPILYVASFIVQITHPSGLDNGNRLSVTCSQLLLGLAGGLFPLPAMALVQAGRKHAQLSTLIGAYMTACRFGGGIGQLLAGVIWVNVLKPNLYRNRHEFPAPWPEKREAWHQTLTPDHLYSYTVERFDSWKWGTKQRNVLVNAVVESHRILCAIGIGASVLLIVLTFFIHDASVDGPQANAENGSRLPSEEGLELEEMERPKTPPAPLQYSRFNILM